MRIPRTLPAAIALLIPLSLLGCEQKGIPAPAADIVQPARTGIGKGVGAKETNPFKPIGSAANPSDTEALAKGQGADAKSGDAKSAKQDDGSRTAPDQQAKGGSEKTVAGAAAANGDGQAKAAPKEDEPEPTKGEKKTGGSYAAWLQTSGKYVVDRPGAVVAVVTALGEFKCNDQYPYKFKVGSVPNGVSFGATTVRGASIGKKTTSLRIPFTPTSKGAKTISGTFYFSVCNEETCHIKKQPMSVSINVE